MECVTGDGEEEVREFFINDNGYLVQVTDRKYRVTLVVCFFVLLT